MQKKRLSQEKKLQTTYFLEHVSLLRQKQNILNLKEFTQPTETRLYLWYTVFMPPDCFLMYVLIVMGGGVGIKETVINCTIL